MNTKSINQGWSKAKSEEGGEKKKGGPEREQIKKKRTKDSVIK